ncbi:MAG: class I SAM-dependent methyltransferase [Ruminococcaceae bacterium]|nr:class I SAM-dependent methyltransferase [Oscillospiraceae bacterium]
MIYDLLAPFYDRFNGDIDYAKWADFIESVIKKEYTEGTPSLVLDLGCGTGSMTLELAKRGYDMTGIDYSPEMLDIARGRGEECGLSDKMLWLCQDMRGFELYGTVDVTVSCLDALNHLVARGDLDKCLSLVHNYLIPNGLFIFDINGKGKFERVYGRETYAMEDDGALCIWQNYYNEKSGICDFYITLFCECEDGRYERYDEEQRERMYTLRMIRSALARNSFEFIGAYSDFDFSTATDNDDRIYVVAKCIKDGKTYGK